MAEIQSTQTGAAPERPTNTPVTPQQTNGLAIAALVTGIVAFMFGWVPFLGLLAGVAAVVLGIVALKKGTMKGMSIAGIITGGLAVLWNLIVSAFFVIALIAGGAALTDAAQELESQNVVTEENQKEYAVGESIALEDRTLKVDSIERDYQSGNEFNQPESGNEFVVVTVTIRNDSDGTISFNTFDFEIRDSSGTQRSEAFVMGVEGTLDSGSLAADGTVTGKLVYEVPKGDTGLKLLYTPNSLFSEKSIVINL